MNSRTLPLKAAWATAALLAASGAFAAGPLYTTDNPRNIQPLRWDTSKGPIPVATDVGVYTWLDAAETVPFLTNAQADGITAYALAQWSNVATSTWRAVTDPAKFVKYDQVPSIGGNVAGYGQMITVNTVRQLKPGEVGPERVYGVYNGGGFYVNYDTDGSILETFFGVPRNQILGVAFPEFAEDRDGDGEPETITEATALMNGWLVSIKDTTGSMVSGVFTHEFGHAINLSHAQVNGPIAYSSTSVAPRYPGVKGCVSPLYRWTSSSPVDRMDPKYIETMYPFIDTTNLINYGTTAAPVLRSAGFEQSSVDRADDIAAISNLYPTAAYLADTGSITGVLRLKDGRTPYRGINIIARNIADPLGDAVSAMSGDQTQGKAGPDGRFTIRGLTPGQSYVLYIEQISAGGYPTTPQRLVSQGEYWNMAESSDPATDLPCDATPIVATAGGTQTADITFNGYAQGVQYTPIVDAFLTDLAKNGSRSAGIAGATAFIWDVSKGFEVLPPEVKAAGGSITRNGGEMIVQYDFNANGVQSAAVWNSSNKRLSDLGSLNNDTCGGVSSNGRNSVSPWAIDDSGSTVVGLGYVDVDGNGSCQQSFRGEILPTIWTSKGGMRTLSTEGFDLTKVQYIRAHAISGNGRVILGAAPAGQVAVAWVDQGKPINLTTAAKDANGALWTVTEGYPVNVDGSRAALATRLRGMVLWNALKGTGPDAFVQPPGLKWCTDIPYRDRFGRALCDQGFTHETIVPIAGEPYVLPTDISDDGRIVSARAGTSATGFYGVLWIDGLGWIKLNNFFRAQGVAEAYEIGVDNPLALNGKGNEMIGNIAGISASWYVDLNQVFVCSNGVSMQTGFPSGFIDAVKAGAKPGRCEHL